jgi:hypothetical protein
MTMTNTTATISEIQAAQDRCRDMGYGWMPKTRQGGEAWAKLVEECGCRYMHHNACVTVTIQFTPGDKAAFSAASSLLHSLVGRCPKTACTSTWGHDGVGGEVALQRGSMELNTGSVSKRFLAGLSR